MNTHNEYISYWLRRFLLEYATTVRNLSKNTLLSYRDTFKLLLPYLYNPQIEMFARFKMKSSFHKTKRII